MSENVGDQLPKNSDIGTYTIPTRGDIVYMHRWKAGKGISTAEEASRHCLQQSHNPPRTWFVGGCSNYVHPHDELYEGNYGKESNDPLLSEGQGI